ncbi:MAG: hypothetical protein Q8L85_04430 [Alphaproteobacteria bacterium]|nr:hypothetical protein [Alphaproteobacteria bacterium]
MALIIWLWSLSVKNSNAPFIFESENSSMFVISICPFFEIYKYFSRLSVPSLKETRSCSTNGSLDQISIDLVNEEIERVIRKNLRVNMEQVSADKVNALCPNITYNIPNGQSVRMIRIGDFPFSPCGGTHVNSLQELQGLKITKFKIKKNVMKIQYDIKVL